MKKINFILTVVVFLFTSGLIYSQNTNPVVDNVSFTYDGSNITVTYDISDAEQTSVTVRVFISDNSGVSWSDQTDNATSGTGSVAVTSSPTQKTIVLPYSGSASSLMVKVLADDETTGGSPCIGVEKVYYAGGPHNDNDGNGDYYTTIQIGDQCWLKENLNVGTIINSGTDQTNNGTIEKYCYGDVSTNCDTYGGLYQWDEAMQYSTTDGAQGICPEGWHIPKYSELLTLRDYVNDEATKLIDVNAREGYTYTNTAGFSGLFAGKWDDSDSRFTGQDYEGDFWSTYYYGSQARGKKLLYYYANLGDFYFDKTDAVTVRCIKD